MSNNSAPSSQSNGISPISEPRCRPGGETPLSTALSGKDWLRRSKPKTLRGVAVTPVDWRWVGLVFPVDCPAFGGRGSRRHRQSRRILKRNSASVLVWQSPIPFG
jgi:hypothetical protein